MITGAASGIGRETSRVLAQAGASVVVGDVQEAGLAETAALVEALGSKTVPCRTDVAQRNDVEALAAAAVRSLGCIDIWVNAAGIIIRKPVLATVEADLDRMIAVNWSIATPLPKAAAPVPLILGLADAAEQVQRNCADFQRCMRNAISRWVTAAPDI